ncbi:MAG: DapH/DapD/GlmU-related protein [Colwellia sp.]|jgi:Acetyltransferase (isoleucine patch superfamily)
MLSNILAFIRSLLIFMRLLGKSSFLTVGRNIHVGKGGRLWAPDFLGIGNNSYIGKYVAIEVNVIIGSNVLIANSVKMAGRSDHDYSSIGYPIRFAPWIGNLKSNHPVRKEHINIEDDVWIGIGAILLGPISIGKGAIVAAGAIVTKDVKSYSIVGGNPARFIKMRFTPEEILIHERKIKNGAFEYNAKGLGSSLIKLGE